jgi:hypothetical protein
MDSDYKVSESDVKTVMEAHGLLTEGPILDEALGLASLYADKIRQLLGELPDSVSREKAVLAIIEEGLIQEGFIPSGQAKKFEIPIIEEGLMREGIIPSRREKNFQTPAERERFDKDR